MIAETLKKPVPVLEVISPWRVFFSNGFKCEKVRKGVLWGGASEPDRPIARYLQLPPTAFRLLVCFFRKEKIRLDWVWRRWTVVFLWRGTCWALAQDTMKYKVHSRIWPLVSFTCTFWLFGMIAMTIFVVTILQPSVWPLLSVLSGQPIKHWRHISLTSPVRPPDTNQVWQLWLGLKRTWGRKKGVRKPSDKDDF